MITQRSRLSVLLIEDCAVDALQIQRNLKLVPAPVMQVRQCELLAEGIHLAHTETVHVILLDLCLPDSAGVDTFDSLHRNCPDIPIVVLTGLADEELALEAVKRGAQDYLVKSEMSGPLLARSLVYAVERKQTQTALEQSHEQLERINEELEERVARRTSSLRQMNKELKAEIGQRKQAEVALNEWQSLFRDVADNPLNLIWMTDEQGHRYYCNHGWSSFTGRTKQQVLGEGWLESVPTQEREACRKIEAESGANRQQFHREFQLRHRDGTYRWISEIGTPRFDDTGEFLGYIGAGFDITELRETQEVTRQQKEEITRLARLNVLSEMASGLAHEINQPLFAIVGFLRSCMRKFETGQGTQTELLSLMDEANQEALRAGEIIKGLRRLIDHREAVWQKADLNEVVRSAVALMKADIHASRTHLHLKLSNNLPLIMMDQIQIQQLLFNLLRNALDAMEEVPEEDRHLTVGTSFRLGDRVRIQVSDTGPGADLVQLERLLETQYSTKEHGLGLGLSICRSILEHHRGHLTVQRNPAQGLTFLCEMPMRQFDRREVQQVRQKLYQPLSQQQSPAQQ